MDKLESVSSCGVGYLNLECCLVPTLDFRDSLCWKTCPVGTVPWGVGLVNENW